MPLVKAGRGDATRSVADDCVVIEEGTAWGKEGDATENMEVVHTEEVGEEEADGGCVGSADATRAFSGCGSSSCFHSLVNRPVSSVLLVRAGRGDEAWAVEVGVEVESEAAAAAGARDSAASGPAIGAGKTEEG